MAEQRDIKVQRKAGNFRIPSIPAAAEKDNDIGPSNPFEPFPFQGGANTDLEKPLLSTGSYSELENLRNRLPGLEQRGGSTELLASDNSTDTPNTIYNFSKTIVDEDEVFVQWDDGEMWGFDVDDGSVRKIIYGADAGQRPASWSKVNDLLIYSDGKNQHKIYAGGLGRYEQIPNPDCTVQDFTVDGNWQYDAGNDWYEDNGSATN